jgi:hypothetical protein
MDPTSLSNALAATLSPDPTARAGAEAHLRAAEASACGYGAALLSLARTPACPVSQSAALLLKGLVLRRWSEEDERHFVGPEVRIERERDEQEEHRF